MAQRVKLFLRNGQNKGVLADVVGSYAIHKGELTHVLTGRAVPLPEGKTAEQVAEVLNRSPATSALNRLTFGEVVPERTRSMLKEALDGLDG